MEVGYYPGCSLHASSALYDVQSRLVFAKLGVDLIEIDDWSCCGATSAAKTDDFLAVALPARNLGIAEASGLGELMIPCSSCYSRTLVSQQRLADDAGLKARVNGGLARKVDSGVTVLSILDVLVPLATAGRIAEQAERKLEGLKVACYYGCLLTRFPSDVAITEDAENPQGMEALCTAVGAEPIDWSYKTDCCGASAGVNDGEVADGLMAKIMNDAIARGADCIVTSCPMCQLNLDTRQEALVSRHGVAKTLPVYFITELLGVALGLGLEQMQVDRHFVDAMPLLSRSEL